ncbi:type II toxin-antitoxin system RelE/ParE family toxin [Synergistaceae bacterium OttesenSCG-928-I11]|nr:type II toxin-antitoxin system RelE/ParE family toxin [Synergistaceae bacterium OttesenSCG-928-I11]
MRKIVLSAEARQDIKEIARYTVRRWGKDQAEKYLEGLREQIKFIQNMPAAGSDRSQELGSPFFSFPVDRHVVYYLYDEQQVSVIAILHQAMSPKIHLRLRKNI